MLRPNFQRHSIKASAAAIKERLPVVFNVSPSRGKPELIVETGITYSSIICRVSYSPVLSTSNASFQQYARYFYIVVEDVAYFIPFKGYDRRMLVLF